MPLTVQFTMLTVTSPPVTQFVTSTFDLQRPVSGRPFYKRTGRTPIGGVLCSIIFSEFYTATVPIGV